GAMPLLSWAFSGFDSGELDAVKVFAPLIFSVVLVLGYCTWLRILRKPTGGREMAREGAEAALTSAESFDGAENAMMAGLPPSLRLEPHDIALRRPPLDFARARLSIYGSAMLFAVVHGWPQSVPLFVLGLGLGWLAYRTQSLIGCMVCH